MSSDPTFIGAGAISATTQPANQKNNVESSLQSIDNLKFFLTTAPANWKENQVIRRYYLNDDHGYISCVLWNGIYYITGTDIVKACMYRMQLFGREILQRKKFEEGIFSDLRNLKCGVDAVLEPAKSDFLRFLFKNMCVKTQKKQKVFFWFNVPHDKLFADALERDLKKEALHQQCPTHAVVEPALSFKFNLSSNKSLFEQVTSFINTVENKDEHVMQEESSEAGLVVPKGEALPPEQQPQILDTELKVETIVSNDNSTESSDHQSSTNTDNIHDFSIHVEYPGGERQTFDNPLPPTPIFGSYGWPYPILYEPLITSKSTNSSSYPYGETSMTPIIDNSCFPDPLLPEEQLHQISTKGQDHRINSDSVAHLQKHREKPSSTKYEQIPYQQSNIYQPQPSPYNSIYTPYSAISQPIYPHSRIDSQTPIVEVGNPIIQPPQPISTTEPPLFKEIYPMELGNNYQFPLLEQQPVSPFWNIPSAVAELTQPTIPMTGHLVYTPTIGSKTISSQVGHKGKENIPIQAWRGTNNVGNRIHKPHNKPSTLSKRKLKSQLGVIDFLSRESKEQL